MQQEKQFLLDEIIDSLSKSDSFILFNTEKLTANRSFAFREQIKKAGGEVLTVKKRVFLKSLKENYAFDISELFGHVSVMVPGEDTVGATKALCAFSGGEEVVTILGGCFEGAKCSVQDVIAISKLPSKDEMRSQLLALFEAPLSETLSVMESLLVSVPYCLENKSQQ